MRGSVRYARLVLAGIFVADAASWLAAIVIAQLLRLEFDVVNFKLVFTLILWSAATLAQALVGRALRMYSGRYRYGCFEEVRALTMVTTIGAMVVAVMVIIFNSALGIPRSLVFIALPIALLMMFAVRYLVRLVRESRVDVTQADPVLIYGAGYMGDYLVRRMLTDPEAPYRPVGIIDDDPTKRLSRIRGVDVLGSLQDLACAVEKTGAKTMVVAIANADSDLLSEASVAASSLNLQIKVLPPLRQVLDGESRVTDLRDLSVEDLLGRRPVDTDVRAIAGYLSGKRILVTGAGGSIGSELCRQIHRFGPAELIMLDRDETALQGVELSIYGNGLLDGPEVVLADIRDEMTLLGIFRSRKPEVVFHAAALKHLPMLQQYPKEAWKTNVLGTQNVLSAARAVGVETFINISTDKAANPTSVLGHSKRLAEQLTASMAEQTGMAYLSVRFGNVLGSRGSMLPLFTAMIEAGGPVTVTHPEVTRFFMTIPEACQLVIQAGAIGGPGEVLVLDMGAPVSIRGIAERLIEMSGRRDVEIVYTGLRPGEKLQEVLYSEGECDVRPVHPLISHTKVEPVPAETLAWVEHAELWRESRHTAAAPVSAGVDR